jgi:hypothetical protein
MIRVSGAKSSFGKEAKHGLNIVIGGKMEEFENE